MDFCVLTLFPELVDPFFNHGMILQGIKKEIITCRSINIRDYSTDRHHTVDDRPYGGGSGMVMKPEPLHDAVTDARRNCPDARVILMSPQGKRFDQKKAIELAEKKEDLILVCGRYEGIDERIFTTLVDEELSMGDYVLTGGELAAMTVIDAVSRLIPGVLGCSQSPQSDSFIDDRLEHAQYTRPERFRDIDVPEVLLSGNHEKIRKWRTRSALQRTFLKRPDLFYKTGLSREEKQILADWCEELNHLVSQS